ncbi:aprataxin-like protein [Madurella fahalii]|uniref:Aprataxin-like protein n=1 Tax=Madurella fahalii TaxID=1157608 RepID=A0ABQ0GPI8_9PEZI
MAELAEDMDDFDRPDSPPTADTPTVDEADRDGDATQPTASKPTKNAFAELMAPKHAKPASSQSPQSLASKASQIIRGVWRGALVEYITHPERFPGQVVRVTPHTVLIKDAFPKATVHLLLLPRSPAHYLLHPHAALADGDFLAVVREEAAAAAELAAAELARRLGAFSASSRARNEAMNGGKVPFDALPAGRDYAREIRVGVHAHPSMAHLHVHVISRDMHSDRVRHRKHYNSFTTPFFVPLADYPLAEDDVRRDTKFQNANLAKELVCWRCGKAFGSRFAELKKHLEGEFEEWKRE